jgi:hypothetical protein
MNKYLKMYGWIYEAFGTKDFTMNEFKAVFPSSQHPKVIYDLAKLNFIKRLKRGKYRVIEPDEFIHNIVEYNIKQENILNQAKRKYAFCNSDAVAIWSDGYYWTGYTRGFKPIHIKVLKKDLNYWIDFFETHGAEYVIVNENKTLFGLTFILHLTNKLKIENKNGIFVIPLEEVLDFCRSNELTFRPALEYIDEHYHLNLFEQYEHIH